MFIYLITNTENSKVYIGQTTQKTSSVRWNQHRLALRKNKHYNAHLQAAWNKYGSDAFTFEVLDTAVTVEGLNAKEQYYIELYEALNDQLGYNKSEGGLNRSLSTETKNKIRLANTGKTLSEETRQKLRNKVFSESTRAKISLKNGKPHPAFINKQTGEVIPAGINLSATCRQYNLDVKQMHGIVKGKAKHHKNWVLV